MGKAERIRERNARERIAAQQAAARRAEARRRVFIASGSVLVVLAIVIVLIVAKTLQKPATAASGPAKSEQSVETSITSVPASTLNAVGKGNAAALTQTKGSPPILTSGGKPEVLFMGAEYCPYCAAERWALTVALSRFGTFSNLHFIHSSSADVYPNTPTLTYYKASYTSPYIDFESVEVQGLTEGTTLQTPNATQESLITKWDAPPYVPAADGHPYPFVDFGNQYLVTGAQYDPQDLANLTWAQVANYVHNDPTSTVAKDIDGSANAITAAICKITKDAPAAVCSSAAVQAGEGSL